MTELFTVIRHEVGEHPDPEQAVDAVKDTWKIWAAARLNIVIAGDDGEHAGDRLRLRQ